MYFPFDPAESRSLALLGMTAKTLFQLPVETQTNAEPPLHAKLAASADGS
jgi:hypothetical protein